MENDLDMQELKELVKRQAQLNADTNKVVHSLRRGARMRSLFSFLWWLLIIGVSAYTFYTFVWPNYQQVMSAYRSGQNFSNQMQGQFQGFLGQYFGTSTPR